jgi:hypothetical protein
VLAKTAKTHPTAYQNIESWGKIMKNPRNPMAYQFPPSIAWLISS